MLQSTMALSTTEVEYMSVAKAMKEALWIKCLARSLGLQQDSTVVFYDSQSASYLIKNQMFHEWTKLIGIRYQFICDHVT